MKKSTLKEVRTSNKLFAEFMGRDYEKHIFHTCTNELYESGHRDTDFINNDINWRCYHSSWDWLMEVVAKIESLEEDEVSLPLFDINSHYARIWCDGIEFIAGCYAESPEKVKFNTKIEAVAYVALQVIKRYNKKNKNGNKK